MQGQDGQLFIVGGWGYRASTRELLRKLPSEVATRRPSCPERLPRNAPPPRTTSPCLPGTKRHRSPQLEQQACRPAEDPSAPGAAHETGAHLAQQRGSRQAAEGVAAVRLIPGLTADAALIRLSRGVGGGGAGL